MSSFPWPNPDHEEIRRLRVQNAALRATVERVDALAAHDTSAACPVNCGSCAEGQCEGEGLKLWIWPASLRAALAPEGAVKRERRRGTVNERGCYRRDGDAGCALALGHDGPHRFVTTVNWKARALAAEAERDRLAAQVEAVRVLAVKLHEAEERYAAAADEWRPQAVMYRNVANRLDSALGDPR